MPKSRLERALFGFGLVAIAVLALVVALSWNRQYDVALTPTTVTTAAGRAPAAPVAPATKVAPPATATSPTTETDTLPSAATTTPTKETITQTTSAPVTLTLTAARGDSWIEVRDGSDAGTILYAGVLTNGTAKAFQAAKLYVRFGEAGNIDASVGGQNQRLKPGTYTARFDATGYTFAHS
jgi:hypothetical protein